MSTDGGITSPLNADDLRIKSIAAQLEGIEQHLIDRSIAGKGSLHDIFRFHL